MLWLIDGYNVIRGDPELTGIERGRLEEGRAALLRLMAVVARGSTDEFVVVFDGARATGASPPGRQVRVVFSRPPETADDVLVRMARQHGAGAVVVTSDRTVQDAARRARATAVSASAFLDRVSARACGNVENDADDEVEKEDRGGPRKGNPRRPSRAERQQRRALGRLGPRRE